MMDMCQRKLLPIPTPTRQHDRQCNLLIIISDNIVLTKKYRFQHKNVLITGASAGIGRALAFEFAAEGANLIITARRKDLLDELATEIETNGGKALAIRCDVTNSEDIKNVVKAVHEQIGIIDIAVANAGIPMSGNISSLTIDAYQRVFDTNVLGVVKTAFAIIDDLRAAGGSLVLIGSVAGHIAFPGSSAYAMSKFAVRAFSESLRGELSPQGIKVILISPGFVESELRRIDNQGIYHPDHDDWVPSRMIISAEKCAKKIIYAIHKNKREKIITVNAHIGYWFRQYTPWLFFFMADMVNRKVKFVASRND
jgi:short-subunit dehydrogenase